MSKHGGAPDAMEALVIHVNVTEDPDGYLHEFMSFEAALVMVNGLRASMHMFQPIAHGVRIIIDDDRHIDFVDWAAYEENIERLAEKGMFK